MFLSIALFIVVGALFLLFRLTAFNSDANTSICLLWGSIQTQLLTIDFAYNNGEGKNSFKNYDQEVPNRGYGKPILSLMKKQVPITLAW